MNRKGAVVCLVLALVLAIGVPSLASHDRFEGEGLKISPVYDSVIYANEPCWVLHGWRGEHHPGLQPEIKDEFGNQQFNDAGQSTFRLYIDDMEVILRTNRVVIQGDEPGVVTEWWLYYIQFEPGYFEPGTYELTGVWDITSPNCWDLTNLLMAEQGGLPFMRVSTLTVLEPMP